MSLVGVEMVFFLPVVFALYWLVPRRAGPQNAVLLVASAVFYASWSPALLGLLAASAAVDWSLGRVLAAHPAAPDGTATPPHVARVRRAALVTSLVWNVGLLVTYKYAGFFATSLGDLLGALGVPVSMPVLRLLLPLGLSYTTLQKIAYVVDVHDGRVPAVRSPLTFATFVGFFPQLTAGPIVRAAAMIPQYEAPRRLTPDLLARGASAFLLGYVMKAFVANWMGPNVVDPVFADARAYSAAAHWAGLFGYSIQVFCDFAGYSFLAIGVGRLFGIELPLNFDRPWLSRSLPEMWRRWHITLNTWLFDYIYGPLVAGHGRMRGRTDVGFVVVFLASGLWHGAAWTFVAWGLLHGLGLVVHARWDRFWRSLCRRDRAWVARRRTPAYALGAWALTQGFFLLTLVPFRAGSLADAIAYLRGLVVSPGGAAVHLGSLDRLVPLAAILVFLLGYHVVALGRGTALAVRFRALPAPVRGLAYGAVVVFLLLFVPVGVGTFIYAQF